MASVFRRFTRSRSTAVPASSDQPDQQGERQANMPGDAERPDTEELCRMLMDMGFEREQAVDALKATNGDLSDAVVALLSSGVLAEGQPEQPARGGRRASGRSNSGEQISMEELDAMLNEALKASEQEAEEEQKRREDEQRALDAALAASLDCMGPGPPRRESPVQEQSSSPQSETSREATRRCSGEKTVKRRTLNDGELCQKVLNASNRRQQLESLRPPHHRTHQIAELPPLVSARVTTHLASGKEDDTPWQHPTGTRPHLCPPGSPSRQQHQEARSSGDSRPLSSSTNAGGEAVALDDLEGWTKGSGLFGVASLRSTYPARLLPVAPPRQHASPMTSPQRRPSSDSRPNSRAARLGPSSSSPLLAAAALSIT
mmetsp:Transcript_41237/g.123243  ORF Transcript_41237/g.123243 Transcript_41237/m.123243 type:complete len:374 (+) Transcript_41237:120-1241(+)